MPKITKSAGEFKAVTRLKSNDAEFGNDQDSNLESSAILNLEEVTYTVGDKFIIPDAESYDEFQFQVKVGNSGRYAYGIVCPMVDSEGKIMDTAKVVYYSTLIKTLAPCKKNSDGKLVVDNSMSVRKVPTGKVYKDLKDCANLLEIKKIVKAKAGKIITCTAVLEETVAVYEGRTIVDSKKGTTPCLDW